MVQQGIERSPGDVLRAYMEHVWNAHNVDRFAEFVSEDVVFHPPRGPTKDFAAYRGMSADFIRAFPDLHFEVVHVISQGDLAAGTLVITGTNTGPFRGHAPTGKSVKVEGRPWARVRGGKVVEFWQLFDELGMMQQLGHLPV